MAARRLIIVMLVLLGLSTVLAVMTPGPRERDKREESTTATGTTGPTGTNGTTGGDGPDNSEAQEPILAVKTVKTGTSGNGPPPVATAEPTGRLVLTVETDGSADLSIPDFGRVEVTTEYAPAVFDLVMPEDPGTFKVIDVESGDTVAQIKTKG